jgi:putative endonuclease
MRLYFVYILSSISRVLYIGITNDLERRLIEHRFPIDPDAFTAQYRCTQLVYYEEYTDVNQAIAREKQLKRWKRSKKQWLVETINPEWRDLAPP